MTFLAQSLWQRLAETPFYQSALLGGVAVAITCSLLSAFVVLKRIAFIGEGISHAAFGGVGLALLAGLAMEAFRPVLARDAVIALFCVTTALVIGVFSRRGKLSEDSAIGIVLVAAMALGVFLLDLRSHLMEQMLQSGAITRSEIGYTPSFHNILFGNILFITQDQILVAWILAILVTVGVILFFKELVFFVFDEETAGVFGVRTSLLYYALLVALGLAVVTAMRSLGVVLASSLLILPGVSARCLSNRIGRVVFLSVLVGVVGLVAGLLIAIQLRFASPGAVIVLTLCALLIVCLFVRGLRRRRLRNLALKEAA
jgi:zinc transport system permease protein